MAVGLKSVMFAKLPLEPHHRIALEQAIEYISTITEPLAIVVSGSIVRGNRDPSSDLDIVVLQTGVGLRSRRSAARRLGRPHGSLLAPTRLSCESQPPSRFRADLDSCVV